jgi:hypothetical protein
MRGTAVNKKAKTRQIFMKRMLVSPKFSPSATLGFGKKDPAQFGLNL